jgi:hypothetical protein
MQMQSAYWLEKVLKMICLYVSALLCTLQHIVIHAMQLSDVKRIDTKIRPESAEFFLEDGRTGRYTGR